MDPKKLLLSSSSSSSSSSSWNYSLLSFSWETFTYPGIGITYYYYYYYYYYYPWINHLERMDNTRLPKHALSYKPRGRRDLGCPRKPWQLVDAGTGQST